MSLGPCAVFDPPGIRAALSSLIAAELDRFDVLTASLTPAERLARSRELELRAQEAERCLAASQSHPGGVRLGGFALDQLGLPVQRLNPQERGFADVEGLRAYCDLLALQAESVRACPAVSRFATTSSPAGIASLLARFSRQSPRTSLLS